MATIEYIVPGGGIINDTETGAEVIVPGMGIFNEQTAAVAAGNPYWYYKMLRRRQ